MAFTEPGGESTNRLSVFLNKSYKVSLNALLVRVRGFNTIKEREAGKL